MGVCIGATWQIRWNLPCVAVAFLSYFDQLLKLGVVLATVFETSSVKSQVLVVFVSVMLVICQLVCMQLMLLL